MRSAPLALLATATSAVAVACGGHGASTDMRLTTWDGQHGLLYSLRCDPPGGTAPEPARICAALQQHPNLLVGGRGLDHPCPASSALRVSGRYQHYPINASFSACSWVPGQAGRGPSWSELMQGAVHGEVVGYPFSEPRLSKSERARRRARLRLLPRLHRDEVRLQRVRAAQLASGAVHIPVGAKPDRLARAFLRDLAAGVGMPDGPYPEGARVYSTTRRTAERAFHFTTPQRNEPVYVLVLRFGYRDFTGRSHRDGGALFSIIDAPTLEATDGGLGAPNLTGLGPPFALRL